MQKVIKYGLKPELTVDKQEDGFTCQLTAKSEEPGVYIYKLDLRNETKSEPGTLTLKWKVPSINIKGVWKSGALHDKRQQYDWEIDHIDSRISVNSPLVAVFGHDDDNVITFACSDAINFMEMNALLREEDNHLYCHLTFFKERHPAMTNYSAEIRIDTRRVKYGLALEEVATWWESFFTPTPVPAIARAPLYSTWYQFHQDLDENILLEECKIAADLGYKLIILDDGWQTMDTNRGYDFTGDWKPERFPNLKGFVEKIHGLGMQFGLWFSVPFCGKKSKAYLRFKGKFLTENHRWAPVFDPRYPEVRKYLIEIYTDALKNWKLDAFKLDFIDDFKVYPETELTKDNGRDYANVNEAVDRLLSDVIAALRALKPDIGIEFRQQYIGPAMRKFGNMFRAFDCPNDAVSNRIRIADVKMLCGNSAVHSDPQTWHPDEPVEIAAFQVLNGFFGVPQMSVRLKYATPEHLRMIRFYNKYWSDYAEVLLDGKFTAFNPLANYPILKAEKGGHAIYGIFEDNIAALNGERIIDLLNVKTTDKIAIRNTGASGQFHLTTWDCQGQMLTDGEIAMPAGLVEIAVPASGMARLAKV